MISRHWKGVVKRDRANDYVAHLKDATLPKLRTLAGFVRASILRRSVGTGVEFQVVTVWESVDVIRAFAGDDVEASVVPPVAREMMVEFEDRATHYEVVHVTA